MIPAIPRSAFKPRLLPSASQRSLLITAESPPAAGENGHCFICRRNEPLWTTLSGLSDGGAFLLFLSVITGMMCMAFWHSYLSGCSQICRDTSRISCCWQSGFSCHKDLFDWWLPSFLVDIVGFSIQGFYGCLKMNTGFWWMDSCCLVRYWSSITQISSVEKVAQKCLGCPLVVGSSNIPTELKVSVLIFLPKLANLVELNFPAHKHN